MKSLTTAGLVLCSLFAVPAVGAVAGSAPAGVSGKPAYDVAGRLIFPGDYRDWVFLSAGLNMSYSDGSDASAMNMFGNTFAPRAAYASFKTTGRWPDKTVLLIENRVAGTKGSINKRGQYQTADTMGFEAHVKDESRFRGGWGFFGFENDEKPASLIAYKAQCYSCHQAHAAADTTFAQFYPTLLPIATKLKTLNPAYVAEEAARR